MRASWLIFLLLAACAQKKYVRGPGGEGGQNKPGQLSCTAKFQTSGACLIHNWEKIPKDSELLSFTFKISRPNALDNTPVPFEFAQPLEVVLWMPSMGHGSSPVELEKIDSGTYRASRVFFSMPGEWEIRIEVKNGAALADQAVLNITL